MTGYERFDTFSPPPPKPDPWQEAAAEPATGADEHALGTREAAALLEQTTAEADRTFNRQPPFLLVVAAVTVLVAYGAIWMSVRDQQPYTGPSGTALGVLYGVLALWILFVVTVLRRSLSGRSSRRRRLEGLTFAAVWICVYVFQGALYHVNPDHALAYGVWPAIAPLLVVGAAAAGYQVARDEGQKAALSVSAVALGAFAAFAGPAAVWGVVGVGLSALLLLAAAVQVWRRRRA